MNAKDALDMAPQPARMLAGHASTMPGQLPGASKLAHALATSMPPGLPAEQARTRRLELTSTFADREFARYRAANPQPFDEFRLTADQVQRCVGNLKQHAYFTIPASAKTMEFLNLQDKDKGNDTYHSKIVTFKTTRHASVINAAAHFLMWRINGCEMTLDAHEIEVRWPRGTGASEWHKDSSPKVMTCLMTLAGRGTEFVTPQVAEQKFTFDRESRSYMPNGGRAAIQQHINEAQKAYFYFFAADGLKDESVPKLLHRAPGEENRCIFLARWKERKPRVSVT